MPSFFDRPIFREQKKPDPSKNFFENYVDHLTYLKTNFKKKCDASSKLNPDEQLQFLMKEALARLKIFEALRDGHDYFDEVGCAALGLMGLIIIILGFALAIWEGVQDLLVGVGLIDRADKIQLNPTMDATDYLAVAAAAFVLGIAASIKAAISLITRPVVTAIQGFQPQDQTRFCNADNLIDTVVNAVELDSLKL